MKKLLFALVLAAGAFFCEAQVYLGGNIGVGVRTSNGKPVIGVEINPFGGYMFSNTLGLGLDIGYRFETSRNVVLTDGVNVTRRYIGSIWRVAPYFRWIFCNFEKIKVYADAKFTLAGVSGRTYVKGGKLNYIDNVVNTFNWGVSLIPGIRFNLSDHVSIQGTLNVISLVFTHSDNGTNKFSFGTNNGTPIAIGINYSF